MAGWFPSRWVCAAVIALAVFALLPKPIDASHGWSTYHWPRTSSALKNIPFRRYVSASWVTRYNTAITDWRKASMTKIRPQTTTIGGQTPSCPMFTGQGSVCDGNYGNTGWLGLATISINAQRHILRGNAKQNNTYFNTSTYNTTAWRQAVICQEIGHIFGLGHVNVVFNNPNTGSCMDYTNDPDGGAGGASPNDKNNMHPNAHDYALINSRHNHIGSILPELTPLRDIEMPRALETYNPTVLAQFGTRSGAATEDGRKSMSRSSPADGKP